MGIFRRRSNAEYDEFDPAYGDEDFDDTDYDQADHEDTGHGDTDDAAVDQFGAPRRGRHAGDEEPKLGPYDEDEAPADEVPRLDLGSVRVPVPEGAQLQLELDEQGPLRAVHLVTGIGQFTVSAFAAPRSERLWPEVCDELAAQLRNDGARVRQTNGEWGTELDCTTQGTTLRFLGVDGPRWLLRGVVAGPPEYADDATMLLRDIVRATVVVRGSAPLPVRSPLPIQLPDELVAHLEEQAQAQA